MAVIFGIVIFEYCLVRVVRQPYYNHATMTTEERIEDIFNVGTFNDEEIEAIDGGFKSWEFYQILHFSNEEWYYTDDETSEAIQESADQEIHTEKGIIFCFS